MADRYTKAVLTEGGGRDGKVVPVLKPISAADALPVNVRR